MKDLKPSALVVDDERINTLIFEKLLSRFGIEVTTAGDGKQCMDILYRGKIFDYIFLDIRMPEIDGLEAKKHIDHLFELRRIETPVICITGIKEDEKDPLIMAAGFTDFLLKPINVDALRKIVMRYAPSGKHIIEEVDDTLDSEDEDHIPEAVRNISGIDAEYGVAHCGSVSDYLAALKVFYRSVDEKASQMDEYIKRGYIEDLEMSVHSLKSTAMAVGAKQVSEMAKLLEKACVEYNIPLVYNLTPEFLQKYREVGDELKSVFLEGGSEIELLEISERKLHDAFTTLNELIEVYDRKNADNLLDSLKKYNLPAEWKTFFDRLGEHLRKMDWESSRKLLHSFGGTKER